MPGIDSYTKLMLHFDGVTTTFVDSSSNPKTVNGYGTTAQVTDQSKFGGSSCYFDGSNHYVYLSASEDFNIGTADFTIDMWVRFDGFADRVAFDFGGSGANRTTINTVSATRLYTAVAGTTIDITTGISFSDLTWYHIAIVRASGTAKVYVNGTEKGSASASGNAGDAASELYVGRYYGAGNRFKGWIDEVRLSKGIARWTGAFTPPTGAYSAEVASAKSQILFID